MMVGKGIVVGWIAWTFAGAAFAAGPEPTRIAPATSAIRVDAVLDEPAWQDAWSEELSYEVMPGDNVTPPVRTEVLLSWDRQHFYFAFRAHDPDPGAIRAHLTDRDKMAMDDYVGIVLDTFHDERRAFEFEVNPLGVQSDYFRSEVTGGFATEDVTWDAIWSSAGRITADGYVIEAAIPWSSLRFPRRSGDQVWGITAYRIYPRNVMHALALTSADRNNPCLLCQIRSFIGFAGVTPGRNLELTPTVIAGRTDQRTELPDGAMEEGDVDSEAGLSLRWGITPNLNLNATANPDFSHVEADAAQLDVNVRFALFYPEKRPFFLEGADAFSTLLNIVHSRTIRDPSWGLKLTGKEGKHLIGAYFLEDEITNLIFPANQGSAAASLDLDSRVGVLRYRRDLGKASTLGVLLTDRQGGEYSNRVAGVDGVIAMGPSDTLQFQALESRTSYPEELAVAYGQPTDRFDGSAVHVRYDHTSEHWSLTAGYERLDPEFRADLGFIPRVDTETMVVSAKRILKREEGSWFTHLDFGLRASRIDSVAGELSDEELALEAMYQGPMQSILTLRLAREKEYFQGRIYDQNVHGFTFMIQPTGALALNLSGDFGDAVHYASGRPGDLLRLGPGISYRFGRHLDVNLQHLFERLDVAEGRLYEAELTQSRLTYQFNVRTFVRAILQYYQVDPERTRTLFSQFLFSYKLNPRTVMFLGYSDDHLGLGDADLTRTGRTFFAKLGYAWLF